MEIAEQVSTYRFFNDLVKWGSLAVATLVFFLVLLFCVHAGFFPALVLAAILLGLGIFGLRGKVAADPVHAPS
ncbi:MAG: aa3-type cytochrome c oxidase subunit IV [Caulobacteraceae bacterium]|nr:aa3-type cytochrome c oxidase subunit IV [Caulobacter sp.]